MAEEVDPTKARMVMMITLNFDGTVAVLCPVDEMLACLGLLSVAEEQIKAHHRAKAQVIIPQRSMH
jgi:hypothetical protein